MLRTQLASLILSAQSDKKRNSTISTWREKKNYTGLCVFPTGHHVLGVFLYVLFKMPTANFGLCQIQK